MNLKQLTKEIEKSMTVKYSDDQARKFLAQGRRNAIREAIAIFRHWNPKPSRKRKTA